MANWGGIPYRLGYRYGGARLYELETQNPSVKSVSRLEREADLIVVISPKGQRESGQYAVITDVLVSKLVRGDVSAGVVIKVLEPIRLKVLDVERAEEAFGWDGASEADGPIIGAFLDGCYTNGSIPMVTEKRYLAFLKKVPSASINGIPQNEGMYTVLNSPYSRIGMDLSSRAFDAAEPDGGFAAIDELDDYDLIVYDQEAAEAYERGARQVIERVLGSEQEDGREI